VRLTGRLTTERPIHWAADSLSGRFTERPIRAAEDAGLHSGLIWPRVLLLGSSPLPMASTTICSEAVITAPEFSPAGIAVSHFLAVVRSTGL